MPAVPGVLNTWTKKFGFSVVGQSERANFFDYTFLDFQGTIMCQKVLERTPAEDNVVVSEVFQATQVEGCATVDQGSVLYILMSFHRNKFLSYWILVIINHHLLFLTG